MAGLHRKQLTVWFRIIKQEYTNSLEDLTSVNATLETHVTEAKSLVKFNLLKLKAPVAFCNNVYTSNPKIPIGDFVESLNFPPDRPKEDILESNSVSDMQSGRFADRSI